MEKELTEFNDINELYQYIKNETKDKEGIFTLKTDDSEYECESIEEVFKIIMAKLFVESMKKE